MSSLDLEQEAKPAGTDGGRKWRPNRLGLLWAGSALLHVVAVIALLRSWDSAPSRSVKSSAPVAQIAVDEIQVVRLELAVATVLDGEVVNAVHEEQDAAEVPHVAVPDEQEEPAAKDSDDESEFDSLQLRPAANASITPDARFRRTKWESMI